MVPLNALSTLEPVAENSTPIFPSVPATPHPASPLCPLKHAARICCAVTPTSSYEVTSPFPSDTISGFGLAAGSPPGGTAAADGLAPGIAPRVAAGLPILIDTGAGAAFEISVPDSM
ncbi:MAG: hypothetical protein Q9190_003706 [Brigantiaea leucoxantha]